MVAYLDTVGPAELSYLLVVIGSMGISGLIGWAIGNGKGRAASGFWLGALLGFIGWIIVGTMDPTPEEMARRQAAWMQQHGPYQGYGPNPYHPPAPHPGSAGSPYAPPPMAFPPGAPPPPGAPIGGVVPYPGAAGAYPPPGFPGPVPPAMVPAGKAASPPGGPVMSSDPPMSVGEGIIMGGAVLLLVSSILPWYAVDLGPFGSYSRNGWQAPSALFSIGAIVVGLATAVLALVSVVVRQNSPTGPPAVLKQVLYPIGGSASFVLVLLKFVLNTDYTARGIYVGLIGAALLLAGGIVAAVQARPRRSSIPGTGYPWPPGYHAGP